MSTDGADEPAREVERPARAGRVARPHPHARQRRALLFSPLAGLLAGLAALLLERGLEHATPLLVGRFANVAGGDVLRFRWELLLLPALGGLLSGVIVQLLARQAPGQGTDQMVHAFHQDDGVLPLTGPAVKAAASVGVIASGGSAGPEGPIAGLGAAIGSTLGGLLRCTPWDRRVLLIAGAAAGVGAIFNAPLGGALFAASVLYRRAEFEGSALVSAFVASAVGYATFQSFTGFGQRMLTNADHLHFAGAFELVVYAALGLLCGAAAILLSVSLRAVEHASQRLHALPAWLRPALGGLLTGLVACALPQVMDGRYAMIRSALDGSLFAGSEHTMAGWAVLLLAVVVAKCVATAFTVGSGAAGGVLGPSLFLGGVTGAFLGAGLGALDPTLIPEPLRQALVPVGMAGVFAAAVRTPLAAVVMVMEMTGSYGLIVPLMVVTTVSYLMASHFGLIEAQVASAADSPAHAGDLLVNLLDRIRVGDVLRGVWPAVAERGTPLAKLVASLPPDAPPTTVVVEGDRAVGLISFAELEGALDHEALGGLAVAEDLMTTHFELLTLDQTLYDALSVFERTGAEALPVVSSGREEIYLGVLTRRAVRTSIEHQLAALRDRALREHAAFAPLDEGERFDRLLTGMSVADAHRVVRMAVPAELVGHSLRETDFRRERGATVLAIRTAERVLLSPPDPARPLRPDDQLIVLRTAEDDPVGPGA
jgi:CIC family chloride channel protein